MIKMNVKKVYLKENIMLKKIFYQTSLAPIFFRTIFSMAIIKNTKIAANIEAQINALHICIVCP